MTDLECIHKIANQLERVGNQFDRVGNLLEEICGQMAQFNNSSNMGGNPVWGSNSIAESLENIAASLENIEEK